GFTACTSNKEDSSEAVKDNALTQEMSADIRGRWYLENIVFSDSVYVRPSEEVPDVRQYITFGDDSTFHIQTNCNSISGGYEQKGDSIILGAGIMTEMACDNMATEDALRKILPNIVTLEMQNDSVMRLNTTVPSEYIVLVKANEKK
ncbi:MAG: META domain-containing protein, partial [Muribaculaceae bacterium]|nr:META domain-containing protein [Muribaculaceae bacterium]